MSLVSINEFIEIIKKEITDDRFQTKLKHVNEHVSKVLYKGLCFNFGLFEALIFGEGNCLYIFKKSKSSDNWSLIKDQSYSWDLGEISQVFERNMEVLEKINIVEISIFNKSIENLEFKNELATFDTLCDKISNSRINGKFGWNDDNEFIKGTIFEFEGLKLLAYAGASYITIASQKDGSEEWDFHSSHPTCWRQDGVRRLMRQSRKILTETPVLVTPTSDRTVGEIFNQ